MHLLTAAANVGQKDVELVIFFPDNFAPCLLWCVLALTIPGILFCSSCVLLQLLPGWWGSGRCHLEAGADPWGAAAAKRELFNPAASHSPRDGSHVEQGCRNRLPGADLILCWWQTRGFLRAAGTHHLTCRHRLTASPGMSFAASAASAALRLFLPTTARWHAWIFCYV